MWKMAVAALAIAGALTTGGCARIRADVPDVHVGSFGAPPSATEIRPADPNNTEDLLRENTQLRQRIAYLQDRSNDRSRKYNQDKQEEISRIQADIDRYARERDRYKRALGVP